MTTTPDALPDADPQQTVPDGPTPEAPTPGVDPDWPQTPQNDPVE